MSVNRVAWSKSFPRFETQPGNWDRGAWGRSKDLRYGLRFRPNVVQTFRSACALLAGSIFFFVGAFFKGLPGPEGSGHGQGMQAIEPKEIRVKGGEVKFIITNRGSFPHAFSVEGQGLTKKTGSISAGKTVTLEVNLSKAGEYIVICPVPGHKEQGMEAKLRVTLEGQGQ